MGGERVRGKIYLAGTPKNTLPGCGNCCTAHYESADGYH